MPRRSGLLLQMSPPRKQVRGPKSQARLSRAQPPTAVCRTRQVRLEQWTRAPPPGHLPMGFWCKSLRRWERKTQFEEQKKKANSEGRLLELVHSERGLGGGFSPFQNRKAPSAKEWTRLPSLGQEEKGKCGSSPPPQIKIRGVRVYVVRAYDRATDQSKGGG